MEHLFSPCIRLYDLLASQGRLEERRGYHPALFRERNLNVSTEQFLSTERAFTYADLYGMLGKEDAVTWLTPHVAVVHGGGRAMRFWSQLTGESHRFTFNADGTEINALARSHEHLLEISDIVLRLLAASVVRSIYLTNWSSQHDLFINAPTLAYLMEHCRSLKILKKWTKITAVCLATIRGQVSRLCWTAVKSRVLEQALWQRSLDVIRDRPSLIFVLLTIWFSRMGCAETVV
jgi:hypothetical protein